MVGFARDLKLGLLPTLLFLLINAPAFSAVRYVNLAAPSGGNGSSWANAFQGLQQAIDNANPGDMIWVAQGIYKPTHDPFGNANPSDPRDRTFYLKHDVAIFGGFAGTETALGQRNWAANTTILSGDFGNNDAVTGIGATLAISNNGEDAYHVLLSVGDFLSTEINGFTIKGGSGTGDGLMTVEGQPIYRTEGGGLFCMSQLDIANCTFFGNQASYSGGGMVNRSAPVLSNCSFVKNFGEANGGGLGNKYGGSATLSSCLFNGNRANVGGGMYNLNNSPATLTDCSFIENGATPGGHGGGMHSSISCSPVLTNCVFKGNTAANLGGGMGIEATCSPVLTNCLFSGNFTGQGGAIYNASNPVLTNCTIAANNATNSGGGIFNAPNAAPVLKNCILWGNSSEVVGPATVTYSNVQGGHPGTGNTNVDPVFIGLPGFANAPTTEGNLRLNCSPFIDDGSSSGAPAFDLDNNPRPVNLGIDMGAFELQTTCLFSLPIELVSFSGKSSGREIALFWQSASELGNDHFQIEHSPDGRDFSPIGTVKSLGNSVQPQMYGFTHQNPAAGINYYRLKQVGIDGKIVEAKTITVQFEGDAINLFPNPTKGIVDIMGGHLGEEISVRMIDPMGREIGAQILQEGTKLDLGKLPTGVYLVEIRTARQTFVGRIFKE